MNDKPKGRTIPKQKLHIQHFDIDVPYSQGTKSLDRVQAVNLSLPEGDPLAGKPLRMTIFNPDLKPFVRGKEFIIADIEEREREGSEYGPDRTIVQVYDDQGEPISRKKGGGGYQRRSLEDDLALEAVKRRSIEGQNSVTQVGEFFKILNGFLGYPNIFNLSEEAFNRISDKYWRAVEKGLDNYLAEPPISSPKPDQRAQDAKPAADKSDKVSKDKPPTSEPIKHIGDLLTRALKLKPPVTRGELFEALGKKEGDEIDLAAAWKKAQEISAAKVQGQPKAFDNQPGPSGPEKTASGNSKDPDRLFE